MAVAEPEAAAPEVAAPEVAPDVPTEAADDVEGRVAALSLYRTEEQF